MTGIDFLTLYITDAALSLQTQDERQQKIAVGALGDSMSYTRVSM